MTTKRRDELLVGLLLLVAVVLGIGGTIWIARGGLASGYPMFTRFKWGSGLKQGQPVLLAGVLLKFGGYGFLYIASFGIGLAAVAIALVFPPFPSEVRGRVQPA